MNKPLIIVKVGKTSKIRLKNIKAYRAVTFGEAKRLLENNENAVALIIESVSVYEKQDALELVYYLKEKNKPTFVHCVNGASTNEEEIASMLGVKVTSTLDELQSEIARKLAIMVSTAWGRKTKTEETEKILETRIEETRQVETKRKSSSDLFEALTAIKDSKQKEEKCTVINTKSDLISLFGYGLDLEEPVKEADEQEETKQSTDIIELSKLLEQMTIEKQDIQNQLGQAFDRIQKLIDIKEAVELDRDKYRDIVETLEQEKSNTAESNKIAGSQLEAAKQRIVALQQSNIELEQQVIEFNAEKIALNKRITGLVSQVEETSTNLSVLTMEIEEKQQKIESLTERVSKSEALKYELDTVIQEKQALEITASGLRKRIEELTEKVNQALTTTSADDMERINSLQAEINRLTDELDKANERKSVESRGRQIVNRLLTEAVKEGDIARKALVEKNEEISELTTVVKNLKYTLKDSEEELQLLREKYDGLEKDKAREIEKLGSEIELNTERYNTEISSLRTSIETKESENKRLKIRLQDVQSKLDKSEIEMTQMMLKAGTSENEIDLIRDAKETLEEANFKLEKSLKVLKDELMTVKSKVSMVEDANTKLEETNRKLRAEQLQLKAKINSGVPSQPQRQVQPVTANTSNTGFSRVRLRCHYSEKGQIIPVFGSGSNGVTTMAISIARKLPAGSKVVVLDMDLANPKMDSWFKMSPYVTELADIQDSYKRTGLGALFERGAKYVRDNKAFIFKPVALKKGLTVHYFSGSLITPDPKSVMSVEYTDFMAYLGETYDYIIADLGKLGASEITNEFIRMFTSISPMSVMVTLPDGVESRNINVRLTEAVEDRSKLLWVLNKATTTKLNSYVAKMVEKMGKTIIFPMDNSISTNKSTFDIGEQTKGRFMDVIETLQKAKESM